MARWITQTLDIDARARVTIESGFVVIGSAEDQPGPACFLPESREDANAMAIALRLAAKRLEEIGKGLN